MPTNNKHSNDPSQSAPEASDDENRIDWARKQKAKRIDERDVVEEVLVDEDESLDAVLSPTTGKKPEKDKSRKKRRHLVYDEDRDAVVVKRKRRRQTDRLRPVADADDWDDEF